MAHDHDPIKTQRILLALNERLPTDMQCKPYIARLKRELRAMESAQEDAGLA